MLEPLRYMHHDLHVTSAYRYDLPEERIATTPAEPRESARLLVMRADAPLEDHSFMDFPSLLRAGDVLILNETRVIRARLHATREGGGAAEIVLLRPTDRQRYDPSARRWYALVKPGRRLHPGARVRFGDAGTAEILGVVSDGVREMLFDLRVSLDELLEHYGEMPLPPYVGAGDAARADRYQTVFARVPGSVAAPTASLHFSDTLLEAIRQGGVTIAPIVLDVGLGTFKPIASERIDDHVMHAERYSIPDDTATLVRAAKRAGRRVVAAGTTVMRALEACAARNGEVVPEEADTALFIKPGFAFRVVDALLTNFHLPASTLLVLVAAFTGYDRMRAAYRHAVHVGYRFYSFGDAMFAEREASRLF
jgi:S-adenosylmethionine:tRNA ribosyltransferase-isomerase